MAAVVVIGGYGNAGRSIVELLLRHTDRSVVVAGRHLDRAEAFADSLADPRVTAARADATDPASLAPLLVGAEALVVAAGTSAAWRVTAQAALDAGCHQLDLQIGSAKNAGLRALDGRAREAGVCIVTDCGFHPGVPAAMVRAVAADRPGLATAVVSSWIALDWTGLGPFSDSTVAEMVAEFADYRYEALVDGQWVAPRGTRPVVFPPPVGRQRVAAMGLDEMRAVAEALVDGRWVAPRGTRPVVFPRPVGRQRVAAMGLDEMRAVAEALPGLRETGFYVGGFPTVVNYGVIPLVYAGMKVAPARAARPLGRLLDVGLRRFSRPPYATFLQLDGGGAGEPVRPLMRLRHDDAYLLTAAPVVAAIRQVLADPRPGVHLQGMLVEPTRFFADLAEMGVEVWVQPASTKPPTTGSP